MEIGLISLDDESKDGESADGDATVRELARDLRSKCCEKNAKTAEHARKTGLRAKPGAIRTHRHPKTLEMRKI